MKDKRTKGESNNTRIDTLDMILNALAPKWYALGHKKQPYGGK